MVKILFKLMFSTLNIYPPPSYNAICMEKQFLTKMSSFSFKYIIAEKTMSAFIFTSFVDIQKIAIYLSPYFKILFNKFTMLGHCATLSSTTSPLWPTQPKLHYHFCLLTHNKKKCKLPHQSMFLSNLLP